MNREDKETVFIADAKADLDEALRTLDPAIASRLRMARHRALDAAAEKQRVPWLLPAVGFASASLGVLALFFLLQAPEQKQLVSRNTSKGRSESRSGSLAGSVEDLELLASSEAIEFYEDLEFYGWLAEGNRAG